MENKYVIYQKGRGFWRAGSAGYTDQIYLAGLYEYGEAQLIAQSCNKEEEGSTTFLSIHHYKSDIANMMADGQNIADRCRELLQFIEPNGIR